jgi:hypothetical protein
VVEGPHGALPDEVIEREYDVMIVFLDSSMEPSTELYELIKGPVAKVNMLGISVWSFGDFAMWPGFPAEMIGDVVPSRAAQVVNAYTVALFDHYLKGEETPLLDGPSPNYPEVEIETRGM